MEGAVSEVRLERPSPFSRNLAASGKPGGGISQARQSTSCSCINCNGWGVAVTLGIIEKSI